MEIEFSKRTKDALVHAHDEAIRFNSIDITPEHFFLGIIKTDDRTRKVLNDLGVDTNGLMSTISRQLTQKKSKLEKEITLSKSADKIMKIAYLEAKMLKEDFIEPHHLLLAALRDPANLIQREFDKRGIIDDLRNEIGIQVESGNLKSKWGFLSKWL